MLLAFDIGNTSVKAALFDGEEIASNWGLKSDTALTADDYGAQLIRLLRAAQRNPERISGVALCSVVPGLTDALTGACRGYIGPEPFVVESGTPTPVTSEYDRALGVDRLMAVVGAAGHYGPGPLVVVDLGTAVKIDALNAAGVHVGGAIAPGIGIAVEEMFERTARLSHTTFHQPLKAVGGSNAAAIDSGVILGFAGMVNGMVARFSKELGSPVRVVATGGWAPRLADECKFDVLDANLTVKGVRIVYEMNRATG